MNFRVPVWFVAPLIFFLLAGAFMWLTIWVFKAIESVSLFYRNMPATIIDKIAANLMIFIMLFSMIYYIQIINLGRNLTIMPTFWIVLACTAFMFIFSFVAFLKETGLIAALTHMSDLKKIASELLYLAYNIAVLFGISGITVFLVWLGRFKWSIFK